VPFTLENTGQNTN